MEPCGTQHRHFSKTCNISKRTPRLDSCISIPLAYIANTVNVHKTINLFPDLFIGTCTTFVIFIRGNN